MTPESLVEQTKTLFSLPAVAVRVNQLIDDPETRPADFAEVILCDPGLSARLLRLVNSAYYARPRPVDTVSQAVYLIGQRALRDLVFATYTVDMFKGLPPRQVNMERFWFHGVACGIAARELASRCGLRGGESLFLAGLMHSLGKLMFFSQCADGYREVLRLVEAEGLDAVTAETRVFGFNYAELGAALLNSWHFPEALWKAVAYHIDPAAAPDHRLEADIVHGAERIARIVQATSLDGADAPTARAADDLTGLSARLTLDQDILVQLPTEISLQVIEVFEILVPGATLIY